MRQAAESTTATSTSQESSSSTSETRSTRNTAIVVAAPLPAPALQDKDILERLVAENPDGVRLNSFCTSFKGPKRELPENQQAATPAPRAVSTPTKSPSESGGAPVVQIIDGEIVLQESSLMFPGQRRSVQEVEAEFDVVEEDTQLAIVGASYNSFVNRKGPQHWTVDETKRFFNALRQLGTDFCSMEAFFDNRTRKQLKRKYRSELTKHPTLVEMALDPKHQIEIGTSMRMVAFVLDPLLTEERDSFSFLCTCLLVPQTCRYSMWKWIRKRLKRPQTTNHQSTSQPMSNPEKQRGQTRLCARMALKISGKKSWKKTPTRRQEQLLPNQKLRNCSLSGQPTRQRKSPTSMNKWTFQNQVWRISFTNKKGTHLCRLRRTNLLRKERQLPYRFLWFPRRQTQNRKNQSFDPCHENANSFIKNDIRKGDFCVLK
jgi:hypothetical protein